MDKELLEKITGNKLVMDIMKMIAIDKEFYVNHMPKVTSLEECLDSVKDEIIESIYVFCHVLENKEVTRKDLKRDQMTKYLKENLSDLFRESLSCIGRDVRKVLDDCAKNNVTKVKCDELLHNGFMYAFIEDDDVIYVVPEEFIEIYNNCYTDEMAREYDIERLRFYISSYSILYGMIPKKIFDDAIINYYKLDLTVEEIEDVCEELGFFIYNDYYSISIDEPIQELEEILELEEGEPYCILEDSELSFYQYNFLNLIFKLQEALKLDDDSFSDFIINFGINGSENIEECLNWIDNSFKPTKKNLQKVRKILEESDLKIRSWIYHGYTESEYENVMSMGDNILPKKPKKNDLKSCLKLLSDDVIECLYSEYKEDYLIRDEISLDELSKLIIDYFEDKVDDYIEYYMHEFMPFDGVDIKDARFIDSDDTTKGFIFGYYEDDKVIGLIPDEIKEIINDADLDDDYDYRILLNGEAEIDGYLALNGIIEKKKLQKLLEENHDICFDIEYLDNLCMRNSISTYNDYYLIIPNEMADDLINVKKIFKSYKKLDLEYLEYEEAFKEECIACLRNINVSEDAIDEAATAILLLVKSLSYSDEILLPVLEGIGVNLRLKDVKKLTEIIKKYKNNIAIWAFNGYSVKEAEKLKLENKQKNVGRNEPCICGSGKKYKKCCGK